MTIVERPAIGDVEVDAFGLLRGEVDAARNDRTGLLIEEAGRLAVHRRTELVVDAVRAVIAQIDDRLCTKSRDQAFDFDLVIVDREVETRQEAGFEHRADRQALADFVQQGGVAARKEAGRRGAGKAVHPRIALFALVFRHARPGARCGRSRVEHCRDPGGGAIGRAVRVVADERGVARVGQLSEVLAERREQVALRRCTNRLCIGRAETNVRDRRVQTLDVVSPDRARRRIIVGDAGRRTDRQFFSERNIGEQRNTHFAKGFLHRQL